MKHKKILSAMLIVMMVFCSSFVQMLPTAAVSSDSLILYPTDGYTYYCGQTITLGVYVPEGTTGVVFDLDGSDLGAPQQSESHYYVELDVSEFQNGTHTFTVSAAVGNEIVENSSTFELYCAESTIAYNNFNISGSSVTVSDLTACEKETDKLIWSFGGLTTSVKNDSSGNKWIGCSAQNGSYPEIRIGLNNKFFGYAKVGANNGLSEGIVTTEFDIKMNSKSGLSLNGSGAPGMTSSSYYGSSTAWRLFTPDGKLGTSSLTYTYGADAQWGHVKVIADYSSGSYLYYYNGQLVHTLSSTPSPYGISQQWDMYGLKIQSYGSDVNYELDNFKISHRMNTHMGHAEFSTFALPSDNRLDAAFSPRGYVPSFDMKNTVVSLVEGTDGAGDKALHIAPNGDANPNYRFYFQNKPYKNADYGVLKASFDAKADAKMQFRTGSGFGFSWTDIFSTNGSAGMQSYETGKWHHIEITSDFYSKKALITIDGKPHSRIATNSNFVPSEYLHLLVYGNSSAGSGGIAIDNIHFDYYDMPQIKGLTEQPTSKSDSVSLDLTKPFASLTAKDVEVEINGSKAEVTSISQSDSTLRINLADSIGVSKDVKVIIKKTALIGNITPLSNDMTYSFDVAKDIGFAPISISTAGSSAKAEVTGKLEEGDDHEFYIASYSTGENGIYKLNGVNKSQILPYETKTDTWKINLDSFPNDTTMIKAFIMQGMKPVAYKMYAPRTNADMATIGKTILDDTESFSGKNVHPRLMLTKTDFDRIKTVNDTHYKNGIATVIAAADKLTTKNSSGSYIYQPYEYEIADGIRLLPVSRGVLSRVQDLSMAYSLTGDDKYAERTYAELESAASFPDWNPKHFLDVGEMCNAFAIGYDRIYDWMNEDQRATLREAIINKGLLTALDDYLDNERERTFRWYQAYPGSNWKFVCDGGVSNAVLAIFDDPGVDRQLCEDILGYAYRDVYAAVRNLFYEDGSYDEGFTYWTYSSVYLGYYSSALRTATGTDYGLTAYEPLRESAYYVQNISSNRFISFNFGDAEEVNLANEIYLWYGKTFNDPELSGVRASRFGTNVGSLDLLWYNHNEYATTTSGALGYGSVGGSEAAFRSGWKSTDLYAAIHFGDNGVYHAHSDTGSFVIEYGGKRFFNDLGQDNYNVSNYKNAYRYRTEGHNTIVMRSRLFGSWGNQESDSKCFIDQFKASDTENSYAICDMTDAYSGKGAIRGMMMTKDKKAIIVQDELTPGSWYEGYWFAHTKASVSLTSDKRGALLNIDGVKMWVQILSDNHTFSIMDAKHLSSSNVPSDQYDNSAFKKLAIKFTGNNKISVAFIPLSSNENMPSSVPAYTEMSQW